MANRAASIPVNMTINVRFFIIKVFYTKIILNESKLPRLL